MKCPTCGQRLERIAERLYVCKICAVFYPLINGKLGYPMAKPPKRFIEEKIKPTLTPINLWHEFLKKWGLTNQQYQHLPKTLKDFYRYHYKQWLRQLEADKKKKELEEQITLIRPKNLLRIP